MKELGTLQALPNDLSDTLRRETTFSEATINDLSQAHSSANIQRSLKKGTFTALGGIGKHKHYAKKELVRLLFPLILRVVSIGTDSMS